MPSPPQTYSNLPPPVSFQRLVSSLFFSQQPLVLLSLISHSPTLFPSISRQQISSRALFLQSTPTSPSDRKLIRPQRMRGCSNEVFTEEWFSHLFFYTSLIERSPISETGLDTLRDPKLSSHVACGTQTPLGCLHPCLEPVHLLVQKDPRPEIMISPEANGPQTPWGGSTLPTFCPASASGLGPSRASLSLSLWLGPTLHHHPLLT